MSIWPNQSNVDSFYGNPRGPDGQPSAAWEQKNLILVKTPWQLITAWDSAPVRGIRIHSLCAETLQNILKAIWVAAGQDEHVIKDWGMNLYGGGYSFRLMRGSNRLSMHSWGCAVDFDPERNKLGDTTPNFANCTKVLDAFNAEGWTWGGHWHKPDGMHWQAADV
jgi:hypothetical protein